MRNSGILKAYEISATQCVIKLNLLNEQVKLHYLSRAPSSLLSLLQFFEQRRFSDSVLWPSLHSYALLAAENNMYF